MIIKINQAHGRKIVAICDEDLLGKVFTQEDMQLDLSSSFYHGKKASIDQIIGVMDVADNLNLIGKKIIALAIRQKVIDEENVRKIQGIPYAQACSNGN